MPEGNSVRSRSLVFPVILVLVGGIFLYHSFEPNFEPWPVIWRFWPLLLILIGLGKMWDAMQGAKGNPRPGISIGSTVGVLLFVVIIVLLMWRSPNLAGRHGRLVDHISEVRDLQGVTSIDAVVSMTEGDLTLSGGTSKAFEGEFDYATNWARPNIAYTVSGKSGELNIFQENHGPLLGPDNTWSLRLNEEVPIDLQIKMGAAKGNLDFSKINLKQLRIDGGVGKIDVDLTGNRIADLNVDIHGGVGQAVIRLPKSIGASVQAKGGIGAITTHGLTKQGDNYVNKTFGHTPHTLYVEINGGIGNIDLGVED
jgi:N-terminal domain of toast_rack, DUF2154/Domain of unknown function (DUF5668)